MKAIDIYPSSLLRHMPSPVASLFIRVVRCGLIVSIVSQHGYDLNRSLPLNETQVVEAMEAVKYLGLWIDRRLQWNHHIKAIRTKTVTSVTASMVVNTRLATYFGLACLGKVTAAHK